MALTADTPGGKESQPREAAMDDLTLVPVGVDYPDLREAVHWFEQATVLGEPLARERGRARGGRAGRDGGAQCRQRAVPVAPDCASAARREINDLGARTLASVMPFP
jgi:hypothetical protein